MEIISVYIWCYYR